MTEEEKQAEWNLKFLAIIAENIPLMTRLEIDPSRMTYWYQMGITPRQAFNHYWSEGRCGFVNLMAKLEISKQK